MVVVVGVRTQGLHPPSGCVHMALVHLFTPPRRASLTYPSLPFHPLPPPLAARKARAPDDANARAAAEQDEALSAMAAAAVEASLRPGQYVNRPPVQRHPRETESQVGLGRDMVVCGRRARARGTGLG